MPPRLPSRLQRHSARSTATLKFRGFRSCSDQETGQEADVFRHLCQHVSCFSIEVAQGEVKVLQCWLLETKMSNSKPLSLMAISSDEITEAFSQVIKMSIETQQIEDENSVKVI